MNFWLGICIKCVLYIFGGSGVNRPVCISPLLFSHIYLLYKYRSHDSLTRKAIFIFPRLFSSMEIVANKPRMIFLWILPRDGWGGKNSKPNESFSTNNIFVEWIRNWMVGNALWFGFIIVWRTQQISNFGVKIISYGVKKGKKKITMYYLFT